MDPFSEEEMKELRWAYRNLEHPSLAARMTSVMAFPIEEGFKLLPKKWRKKVDRAAMASISTVLKPGALNFDVNLPTQTTLLSHKLLATGAGAVGGFFGPLTLLAELPLVTMLMLHSIAAVARSEGEDLSQPETRLACAQVFALGGRTTDDNAADLGYYALRATLSLHFARDIVELAAGTNGPHIPLTINLMRAIASRFGVVISERAAARMVPVAGAASGAVLNLVFMNHFQDVARGHFIVRRLERIHGSDAVKEAYEELAKEEVLAEKEYSPVEGW